MDREELKAAIMALSPGAELEENQFFNIIIPSSNWRSLAEELRNNEQLQFDFLFCLSGVDWPEKMWVVYHLRSSEKQHEIVVKAVIENREHPTIPSVCDIWRTAEFHEREAYDLFGIQFENHPDLRRIFLDDDWVGFPMRKDYVDEKNIIDL